MDAEPFLVRMNSDGVLVDASNPKIPLTPDAVNNKANRLADNIIALGQEKSTPTRKKAKLLVYIHGGLNSYANAIEKVQTFAPLIQDDENDDWAYPLFVSWPSGFLKTYAEHLTSVRAGRKVTKKRGYTSAPFIFLSDLLTSIGRYPADLYYQWVNGKDALRGRSNADTFLSYEWQNARENYCKMQGEPKGECEPERVITSKEGVTFNWSKYDHGGWQGDLKNALTRVPTSPIRYTVGTIVYNGFPRSAWNNMKRRTKNMFYPAHLFDSRPDVVQPGASLGEFLRQLFDQANSAAKSSNMEFEVTLVGHSMGAMVINHMLAADGAQLAEKGIVRNIVYMGAACSINDGLTNVLPFVRQSKQMNSASATHFYNLSLNPVAEVSELSGFGLASSGSLLVNIDQHLNTIETPLDRTLGASNNVLSAWPAFEPRFADIGQHFQFKTFDHDLDHVPRTHGEFDDGPFWRKDYWQIPRPARARISEGGAKEMYKFEVPSSKIIDNR